MGLFGKWVIKWCLPDARLKTGGTVPWWKVDAEDIEEALAKAGRMARKKEGRVYMEDEIKKDSGTKYHRQVVLLNSEAIEAGGVHYGMIDVYAPIEAFSVTCPARQHAIKKLLCAGVRGKGDTLQDLNETLVAVKRAIRMERARQAKP